MKNYPEPGDHVIDSRDIIKRHEELTEELSDLQGVLDDAQADLTSFDEEAAESPPGDTAETCAEVEAGIRADTREDLVEAIKDAQKDLDAWHEDNDEELKNLQGVVDEGEGYGDWSDGETLISEDYWVDYVQQLVSDIGDLPNEIPGYIVIDWEATAENIRQDYTTITFGGEDYYMRSC